MEKDDAIKRFTQALFIRPELIKFYKFEKVKGGWLVFRSEIKPSKEEQFKLPMGAPIYAIKETSGEVKGYGGSVAVPFKSLDEMKANARKKAVEDLSK
jgi:hypothetical protein